MSMENNTFILSSILEIIREGVVVSSNIVNGIENYALSEYLLQSVFLKMTGYQEQKLKCICWDIASIDLDFRYKYLNKLKLSECSSKEDKNTVYTELHDLLLKYEAFSNDDEIIAFLDAKTIAEKTKETIIKYFENTLFEYNMEQNFAIFTNDKFIIDAYTNFKYKKNIFPSDNSRKYNILRFYENGLYRERNRCAHNLRSYQQNLPRLIDIRNEKIVKYNYYNYFHLLSIIDEIYKKMYEKLIERIPIYNW